MGLFDKFKKQNTQEEKAEETVVQKSEEASASEAVEETVAEAVQVAEEASVAETEEEVQKAEEIQESAAETEEEKETVSEVEGERRFTLLVEESYNLQKEQSVVIVGNLHGTIQKEDTIYVLHPSGAITQTKVDALEVGPGRAVDKAENERVAIRLVDIKEMNQVPPKFTVLTSIKPQTAIDAEVAVENPWLLGLSMEYPKLYQDANYLNLLIYVICHTNYVVPARVEGAATENPNGTIVAGNQAMVRFPSLQNPANQSQNVFPIFTDGEALSRWKNLQEDNQLPKMIVLRFPDVVSICNGTGVVINPFGPVTIMLPPENIARIISMEGYKQEFGTKPADNVKPVNMDQEAKILVGVPKEDNEIKMIREAIVTFAKNDASIKRVDFLLKVDVKQERSYLCIVDCPEEKAAELFNGLHKAAAPYFKEVNRMEFMISGKSKLATDVVSEKSVIYQA